MIGEVRIVVGEGLDVVEVVELWVFRRYLVLLLLLLLLMLLMLLLLRVEALVRRMICSRTGAWRGRACVVEELQVGELGPHVEAVDVCRVQAQVGGTAAAVLVVLLQVCFLRVLGVLGRCRVEVVLRTHVHVAADNPSLLLEVDEHQPPRQVLHPRAVRQARLRLGVHSPKRRGRPVAHLV